MSAHRAVKVTLEAPGTTAYADGEPLGPLPVTAECVAAALRVLVRPSADRPRTRINDRDCCQRGRVGSISR
ncbi:hypothetical protein [Streptomyces xanthophaeus]|uniref:hypothetical protein n=1 Tax=Streptomyces xanthophaeus TaxID=67385 RepID=UPI003F4D6D1A